MTTIQQLPTYKINFKNDKRWLQKETSHYIFHYFKNSVAEKEIDTITKRQEKACVKIMEFTKLKTPTKKIKYYLYPNKKIKKELMGNDWYAQAIYKDFCVHVLYTEKIKPIGEHEDTHLFTLPWGISVPLFQEGLAEYMVGHGWCGENHDATSLDGLIKKVLPCASNMIDIKKWLALPNKYALYHYCFLGSFVKFIIKKYGKDKFTQTYKKLSREKSQKQNLDIFARIYGKTLGDIEQKWKEFVSTTDTAPLLNSNFNALA